MAVVETAEYFILNGPEHVIRMEIFELGGTSFDFCVRDDVCNCNCGN